MVSLLKRQRFFPILFKILSCWAALLHILLIWLLKFKLESKFTPRSLTTSSHFMLAFLILKEGFLEEVLFPTAIAWNLSGLAWIQLKVNQSIRILLPSCRTFTNSSNLRYSTIMCCRQHSYRVYPYEWSKIYHL